MKRIGVALCGIVVSFLVFSGIAHAEEKFAYIDLSRTFSEYGKTKDYDKKLTDKENSYVAERDKKIGEFNAYKDKLALLSDKDRESKRNEFESKAKVLKDFVTQKETDLRKEQEDKMKDILTDIQNAVKEYSEKEGITFVLNDRVLVYQNKSFDITEEVIKILNKRK